jgi:hypothetical protein
METTLIITAGGVAALTTATVLLLRKKKLKPTYTAKNVVWWDRQTHLSENAEQ